MHTAIRDFRIRPMLLALLSALAIVVLLAGCAQGGSPANSTVATGSAELQEKKTEDNGSSGSGSATNSSASTTQQEQNAAFTKDTNSSTGDESKKDEGTSGTGLWIMSKAVISTEDVGYGNSRKVYDYELDAHGNVVSEHHTYTSSDHKYDSNSTRKYTGMDEHGLWTLEEGEFFQGSSSYTTSYPFVWQLDGEGRPVSVFHQSDEYAGSKDYEWGADGWLVRAGTCEIDEKGLIVKATLDNEFNPGGVDYEFSYSYDDSDRPISCTIETINRETGEIVQNATEQESIEYDEHGNVARIVAESNNARTGTLTIDLEYAYVEEPSLWATQMQRLCWQSINPTQWSRKLF